MNQTNETTTMDYTPPVKLKKITNEKDDHNDIYCFECHTEGDVICCEMCPRVYHLRCLGLIELPPGDWMCPECETILSSSTENNRPETLKRHSMQEFHTMLTFALRRMKSHPQVIEIIQVLFCILFKIWTK
ncbi:unnamed protein product [Didymodactylos carnosus]|uniref:PHD-type domain-containing protein n=1 Tax=Didymodactylos carnosus TaxID=1234261 RepID=A0A8S2CV84_9BILA|nr:unnamed protein product [Didymodactylos carnosus]CAF3551641.1 unnamed protein product [Didymodactylos carnosus]